MLTWLKIWSVPIGLIVAWFVLASNDINLGTHFLSRATFDQFIAIYTNMLGVPKEDLPLMFGKAVLIDGSFIGLFIAYRKRKTLGPWIKAKYASFAQTAVRVWSGFKARRLAPAAGDQWPTEE